MLRIVVVLLGCAVLGAGAWWWLREPAAERADVPALAAEHRIATVARESAPPAGEIDTASTQAEPTEPPPQTAPDYHALLRESNDYWAFAEKAYAAAKQGDAAAQYWLASALTYCESLYDWYFIDYGATGGKRHRTLDEAQQLTATRKVFTPDDVRDIQSRCERLRSTSPPPFGTAAGWMDAAANARYPLAQASRALNQAMKIRSGNPDGSEGPAATAARSMAMEALRTRDPLVMATLGDIAANLATDPAQARQQQWVWPLAACLREADCASMKEWMRLFCHIDTQCQPFETPVDIIRRQAGNDYDAVERRAREINEKLDAGTLTADDIGR